MDYIQKLAILAQNLKKSQKVNSYDFGHERESDTLAHSLIDMEESFNAILKEYLPKLSSENTLETDIDEILLDIGEELRHVLYHIKDPKYFRYILE